MGRLSGLDLLLLLPERELIIAAGHLHRLLHEDLGAADLPEDQEL